MPWFSAGVGMPSVGPSVPSTESVVRNLELMDCEHRIDKSLLPPVDEFDEAVAVHPTAAEEFVTLRTKELDPAP